MWGWEGGIQRVFAMLRGSMFSRASVTVVRVMVVTFLPHPRPRLKSGSQAIFEDFAPDQRLGRSIPSRSRYRGNQQLHRYRRHGHPYHACASTTPPSVGRG